MLKKYAIKSKLNKKTAVWGGVFLCVIIVVAIIGVYARNNQQSSNAANAIFTIEGKNYSKSDVEKLTRYPVNNGGMSKDEAAKAAYDNLSKARAAEVNNVMPPKEFIERYKKEAVDAFKTNATAKNEDIIAWADVVGPANAVDASLNRATPAGLSGYSYVFYFGQHQQFELGSNIAGAGDPTFIKKDRDAAEKKAKEYHTALQNREVTPQELLDRAKKDQPSSIFAYSTKFDSNDANQWESKVYFQPIVDYVQKQTKKGISEVMVGKAASSATKNSEDMYFYFVDMSSAPAAFLKAKDLETKIQEMPRNYKGLKE